MATAERKAELLAHAEEVFAQVEELQRLGLICDDGDFVPSVHYPPITQYNSCDIDEYFETYTQPADGMTDVYVHVPFCIRHCTFCHYPGLTGERLAEKTKYVDYLIREMDIYLRRFGLASIKPRSILLGGGTPTFMPPALLDHFLTEFDKRIDFGALKQHNVDLDPNSINGDEGTERCKVMRDHGITRLTIGVQSLDDDVLRVMNRPHSAQAAIESVYKALDFGFDVNIEFIFGHPGETIDNWLDVIERALVYCEESGGRFDITIGSVTSLWDFHEGVVPDESAIAEAVTHVDYRKVQVDGTTVTLLDPEAKLDLGGIAKGYIADDLCRMLEEAGCTSGVVNLGGNVKTLGLKPDGSAWKVGIQDIDGATGTYMLVTTNTDASTVTSGIYERGFTLDGVYYHHILDPSTGWPVQNELASVTIFSDSSMWGDALATAAFILGSEDGAALIEGLDGIEAVFIAKDRAVRYTSGAKNYMVD